MEKKYLNLRGISEILSEKEMRKVVGASGGGTGSGFGPCCRCDVTAFYCDNGDLEVTGTEKIENGLFCGSSGQSCSDIIYSWTEFYNGIGTYCASPEYSCTQISW